MGIAIIVKDEKGNCLNCKGMAILVSYAEMVEALAIGEGLELAKKKKWSSIITETDSEVVFRAEVKGCSMEIKAFLSMR